MARKREAPEYRPSERDKDAIEEVRRCIGEAKRWHNGFARRVERRYDAWRGMLPENTKPTGWRSNQHPPYLINIVEGMLSTLEEPNPNWLVVPRPIPGMELEDVVAATDGAEIASYLLGHQMRIDGFHEKAGPLAHQDLIAGTTVGKVHWLQKKTRRKRLEEMPELIYDETGGTLDIANTLDEVEDEMTIRDDPTLEVRDIRDFMWPESATSIESAPWVIDRTFVTYQTLQRMEKLGVYKNTKYIQDTRMDSESSGDPDVVKDRERALRGVNRTRGLVEVVELWSDDKVVAVANQKILLRNEPNMFWHGRKPFVTCSAIPDLFQIPGVSVIEGLASMQEMLWTLQNMRLDATRIAANVITMIRGDIDNPEQYEWAPEAQWIVPDPNAVRVLEMGPVAQAAASTLQSEGLLRGDIQNVMGGLPYTGGAESQTLDQQTATGMSIITNIAQSILARRKVQYQRMFGKVGQMFLELDQQFLREDRLLEVLGEEGARRYLEMTPTDIQGVYDVSIEINGESMMRQERRAEAQALVTMAMQSLMPMAQAGSPLNPKRFWEKLLDSYGVTDKQTYFAETQPQGGQPGMGTPAGAEGILEQMQQGSLPAGGQTNEALAAGPTSPSSAVSMSPAAPMQQSLARNGAGRSV